ncbi:MAG: winged helix family transcriptional regulator, partial [Microbacteriaceae bacterium]|nr:winged helix family transcriptional regulator [Microbacteriaceae bacterium]
MTTITATPTITAAETTTTATTSTATDRHLPQGSEVRGFALYVG